jgi:hypothetical protein
LGTIWLDIPSKEKYISDILEFTSVPGPFGGVFENRKEGVWSQ